MQNDWDSRYEIGGIAICLFLVICIFWVPLSLGMGFEDSLGVPSNTSLAGHIRVYLITLGPFLLPGFFALSNPPSTPQAVNPSSFSRQSVWLTELSSRLLPNRANPKNGHPARYNGASLASFSQTAKSKSEIKQLLSNNPSNLTIFSAFRSTTSGQALLHPPHRPCYSNIRGRLAG
jgi:hypothetical protein